jgi:hypothetical protein
LPPDLSTEVGDLRWKGKAMVGFSAGKEMVAEKTTVEIGIRGCSAPDFSLARTDGES